MILLITEYEWKLEGPLSDGSCVLDLIPTVGGSLPLRISLDRETIAKLGGKLAEAELAGSNQGSG